MTATFRLCETGTLHKLLGIPNQDCANMATGGDIHIIQLCDGMSMAEHGTEAAQAASKAAFDAARQTLVLDPDFKSDNAMVAIRAGFASAYNSLQGTARRNQWNLDELQTTLMLCIYDAASGCAAWGQVGDGSIGVRSGRNFYLALQPQKGSASNATFGLLRTDMWQFGCLKEVDALYVGTDGIADCLRTDGDDGASSPNEHGRALLSISAQTDSVERTRFLNSLMKPRDPESVDHGTSPFDYVGDDRSIAIAWSDRDIPAIDATPGPEPEAPKDPEPAPGVSLEQKLALAPQPMAVPQPTLAVIPTRIHPLEYRATRKFRIVYL